MKRTIRSLTGLALAVLSLTSWNSSDAMRSRPISGGSWSWWATRTWRFTRCRATTTAPCRSLPTTSWSNISSN